MASERTFNLFVGGLALISTLLSVLCYLHSYLPGPQMKAFDELLVETKTIYEKACAEGLLPPDMSRKAQAQLRKYESQGDKLRATTYSSLTTFEILLSFFRGHSGEIIGLSSNLKELRREVLTASQAERARREEHFIQEGNIPIVDSIRHFVTEEHHNGTNNSVLPVNLQEPDSSSASSCTATPRSHSAFYILCIMQRLSETFAPRTRVTRSPASPQDDVDQRPSLPNIEARSRSSTLVEDPILKDSSMRRLWSFLTPWVRSRDTPMDEDLEVGMGASSPTVIRDTRKASCEPTQVNPDTVSMSA